MNKSIKKPQYFRPGLLILAGLVLITLFLGVIYIIGQQVLRRSANEPQLTIIAEAVKVLGKEYPASVFSSLRPVDIAQDLSPFTIVYNAQGNPLAGTGQLHNVLPTIPRGVLDYARERQENRVTWQPETGVRIALVVRPYFDNAGRLGGYVAVGRSLWLTELKEDFLFRNLAVIWMFSLAAVILYILTSAHEISRFKK